MAERIPAAAPRWVHTDIIHPAGWHLAVPVQHLPSRWDFPLATSFGYHAVTFALCPQVEIRAPLGAAAIEEPLDAQFLHDPIGTIAALISRAPCPPGSAIAFAASCDGTPMVVMRGSAEDIEAMLDSMTLPEDGGAG